MCVCVCLCVWVGGAEGGGSRGGRGEADGGGGGEVRAFSVCQHKCARSTYVCRGVGVGRGVYIVYEGIAWKPVNMCVCQVTHPS